MTRIFYRTARMLRIALVRACQPTRQPDFVAADEEEPAVLEYDLI